MLPDASVRVSDKSPIVTPETASLKLINTAETCVLFGVVAGVVTTVETNGSVVSTTQESSAAIPMAKLSVTMLPATSITDVTASVTLSVSGSSTVTNRN